MIITQIASCAIPLLNISKFLRYQLLPQLATSCKEKKSQTIKISFLKHSQETLTLNNLKNRLISEKKCSTNYHKCILDWPLFFMSMYLRICRSLQKKLSSQIANLLRTKKIGPANCKSTCCHICGRSANLTNFESRQILQIFRFAICGVFANQPL